MNDSTNTSVGDWLPDTVVHKTELSLACCCDICGPHHKKIQRNLGRCYFSQDFSVCEKAYGETHLGC